MFFDIFLEFVFVFDNGIFKSDTVRADNVGIDDEIVLGFGVANGHGGIPDFLSIGWFGIHAGNDGGK